MSDIIDKDFKVVIITIFKIKEIMLEGVKGGMMTMFYQVRITSNKIEIRKERIQQKFWS